MSEFIEHLRQEAISIFNRKQDEDFILSTAKDAAIAVVNGVIQQRLSEQERGQVKAVLVEWRDTLDAMIAELEQCGNER